MRKIEIQVQDLRGLPSTGPVARTLLSSEELHQRVLDDFLEDYTEDEANDDVRVLSLLGLLEPDFDLFNFYGTWTSPTQTSLVCGGTAPWLGTPGGIGAIYRQVAPAVWLPDPINLQEPPTLRAMWGFHDQDVWAVGDDKTILRWIGGPMWEPVAGPAELDPYTIHYRGVFGCWPWAVWAIGTDEITGNNVIIYWDGLTWTVDHGINLAEGDLLGLKGVWVGEVPV